MNIGMVYTIKNKINGKQYIGRSLDATRAMCQHFITKDSHPLHQDISRYGKENFECGILYTINSDNAEVLTRELEIYKNRFIKKFDTSNPQRGYNGCPMDEGGEKRVGKHMLGEKNPNFGSSKNKKKVALCNMNGDVIEEYESIQQASLETGFNLSNISQVVNGKRKAVQKEDENGNLTRYTFKSI